MGKFEKNLKNEKNNNVTAVEVGERVLRLLEKALDKTFGEKGHKLANDRAWKAGDGTAEQLGTVRSVASHYLPENSIGKKRVELPIADFETLLLGIDSISKTREEVEIELVKNKPKTIPQKYEYSRAFKWLDRTLDDLNKVKSSARNIKSMQI